MKNQLRYFLRAGSISSFAFALLVDTGVTQAKAVDCITAVNRAAEIRYDRNGNPTLTKAGWIKVKSRLRKTEFQRQIAEMHRWLSNYVARKVFNTLPKGIPLQEEDFQQIAFMSLMDVLERYDPERNSLSTYAPPRIKGALLDFLRGEDFVPRLVRKRRKIFENAAETLQFKLQRKPSPDEVREHLQNDHSVEEVERIIRDGGVEISRFERLQIEFRESEGSHSYDREDKRALPPSHEIAREDFWSQFFDVLTADEWQLIEMRFLKQMTSEQISRELNLTPQNVNYRISQIYKALRETFEERRAELEEILHP